MKQVLVTGASGFLGSYVVDRLAASGYGVLAPSSAHCDLRDRAAIADLFASLSPDIVVHCAAHVGGIGLNQSRPADLFYDNITMGVNVIDACWCQRVKKLVLIGTVCSYPEYTAVPFVERHLWNGYPEPTNAAYGLAKRALLDMSDAYRKQYGLNSIFLIPTNLYGPADNFDLDTSHVIPAMIRKFTEAKQSGSEVVTLWGDGSPTRDFLYVEDAAEAIALVVDRYDGHEAVNLGSGKELSMYDLASHIAIACDYDGEILWDRHKPNGQPRRKLDTSHAAQWFGWNAKTNFGTGLHKTVQWYQAQVASRKSVSISV